MYCKNFKSGNLQSISLVFCVITYLFINCEVLCEVKKTRTELRFIIYKKKFGATSLKNHTSRYILITFLSRVISIIYIFWIKIRAKYHRKLREEQIVLTLSRLQMFSTINIISFINDKQNDVISLINKMVHLKPISIIFYKR